MLYAMQHDGMIGIFGNTDDSLDAQQLGAVGSPAGDRGRGRGCAGAPGASLVRQKARIEASWRLTFVMVVVVVFVMSMALVPLLMLMLAPVRGIFRLGDGLG